jgi:hypothetical protein
MHTSNNFGPELGPDFDLERDSLVLAGHGSDLDAVGSLSRGRHGGSGGRGCRGVYLHVGHWMMLCMRYGGLNQ